MSKSSSGLVQAYGMYCHQGLVWQYNEDRVIAMTKSIRPDNRSNKRSDVSFFAVYDGHGGSFCADYLYQHFHKK